MRKRSGGNWNYRARLLSFFAGLSLCLTGSEELYAEQSNKFNWQAFDRYISTIRNGQYITTGRAEIIYTVARFHLGYARLRLVDSQESVNAGREVKDGIVNVDVNGKMGGGYLN